MKETLFLCVCFLIQIHETVTLSTSRRKYQNGDIIDSYTNQTIYKDCNLNQTALQYKDKLQCINDTVLKKYASNYNCRYVKQYDPLWRSEFGMNNCSLTSSGFSSHDMNGNIKAQNLNLLQLIKNDSFFTLLYKKSKKNTILLLQLDFKCNDKGVCIFFTVPDKKVLSTTSMPTTLFTSTKSSVNPATTLPRTIITTSKIETTKTITIKSTSKTITNDLTNATHVTHVTNKTNVTNVIWINAEFTSTTTVPTTDKTTIGMIIPKKDNNKNNIILYSIIAGCVVLFGMILILVYFCCCRKRRRHRERKQQDLLFNMAPLEDEVFPLASPKVDIYAVPKKKKKTNFPSFKFYKKSKTQNWSGYDDVGGLIEGTYEARESTSAGNMDTEYDASPLYVPDKPSKTIQDDPYEVLGRSNSFKIGRLRHDAKNKPTDTVVLTDTPLNYPEPPPRSSEMSLKRVEHISGKPASVSTFKPGSSIRMKQQRTSIRKGRDIESVLKATHEDVTITPPVSKRSSLDLSNHSKTSTPNHSRQGSRVSSKYDNLGVSPSNSEKTKSYEEIPDVMQVDHVDNETLKHENMDNDDKIKSYEEIPQVTNINSLEKDGSLLDYPDTAKIDKHKSYEEIPEILNKSNSDNALSADNKENSESANTNQNTNKKFEEVPSIFNGPTLGTMNSQEQISFSNKNHTEDENSDPQNIGNSRDNNDKGSSEQIPLTNENSDSPKYDTNNAKPANYADVEIIPRANSNATLELKNSKTNYVDVSISE